MKKKYIVLVISGLIALCIAFVCIFILPTVIFERFDSRICINGIYYELRFKTDDEVLIEGYDHNRVLGDVVISPEIHVGFATYKVTGIRSSVFYECSSLTSITIPESIGSSEDGAYFWCVNLTEVVLPNTKEMRHVGGFQGCIGLESIDIPDSVYEIDDGAFAGCSSLSSVKIPDGMIYIHERAFAGCSSLKTITIPEGVTNIDDEAFKGCSSLTTVRIPKSAELGEDVFRGCDNLKEIIYY